MSIAHAFPDEGWVFDLVLPPRVQQSVVWHYTDGAGMLGVLDSGALRATSVLMLNDSVEFRHGAALVRGAWLEHGKSYPHATHIGQLLERAAQVLPLQNTYVVCASSDGNSLSQFRAYGSYAIGINPGVALRARLPRLELVESTIDEIYAESAFDDGWRPVIYDSDAKRQHIERLFGALQRLCDEWPDDADGVGRAEALAQVWYNQSVAYMKHEAFRDEKEVRLSGRLPIASSGVNLRAGRLGISSYVEVEAVPAVASEPSGNAPITEVRIGPGLVDPVAAATGVRIAIEKLHYAISVELLDSPLR